MNGNEFRLIMLLCSTVYATTPDEDKGQFKNSNSVTLNGRGQLTNVRGGGSACSLKKKKKPYSMWSYNLIPLKSVLKKSVCYLKPKL